MNTEKCTIAKCPTCGRILFGSWPPVNTVRVGELAVSGYTIHQVTGEEVKAADWGHSNDCTFKDQP